jgi:MYXO-CTERM domain-containing protein
MKRRESTVTRRDLEAKIDQIKSVVTPSVETASEAGRGILIVGAVLVVVLAYLLGRRRGRKRNTIVEIRRV